jgi:hypothetical protein
VEGKHIAAGSAIMQSGIRPIRPIRPIPPILPIAASQRLSFGSQTALPAKLFSFLYKCKICTTPS